jgi:hypothetical protein
VHTNRNDSRLARSAWGSWPCDNAAEGVSASRDRADAGDGFEHFFAISVWAATWFIIATLGSVLHKKCVAPLRILSAPNGCSTVSRRARIATIVVRTTEMSL